jgi:hypothetical protein
MNATEFAALKAGDKIQNAMAGSFGEVVGRTESGVNIRWAHNRDAMEKPTPDVNGASVRHYTFATTAWMHWDLIEPEGATS